MENNIKKASAELCKDILEFSAFDADFCIHFIFCHVASPVE